MKRAVASALIFALAASPATPAAAALRATVQPVKVLPLTGGAGASRGKPPLVLDLRLTPLLLGGLGTLAFPGKPAPVEPALRLPKIVEGSDPSTILTQAVGLPEGLPRARLTLLPSRSFGAAPAQPGGGDRAGALKSLRDGAQEVARGGARPEKALAAIFDLRSAGGAADAPVYAGEAGDSRTEQRDFLFRLGFKPYGREIANALAAGEPAPGRERVLRATQERLAVLDASRELAVEVLAGAARRGWRESDERRAVALAARLIALRPVEPPAAVPAEVRAKGRRAALRWLAGVTANRIGQQSAALVAEIAEAAYGEELLRAAGHTASPEAAQLREELQALRARVHAVLLSLYTDVEMGPGRFAGRALAAGLVRQARRSGRPELERRLEAAFAERGFRLADFIGNRFILTDRRGRGHEFELRTGDILGTRSRSRRSSEIAAGARPHWTRWWRAWRERVLGNPLGIWLKPVAREAAQVPGQPLRNRLRRWLHEQRKRLANTAPFLKGYSHVGLAELREADGVRMVWVWENEVDAGEGGVRLVSFWDQFLVKDYHARFGFARLDPVKVWESFQAQARARGFEELPYAAGGSGWRSAMSAEEHARLLALPRERAGELAEELHRRAARTIEAFMSAFGLGYGYGLVDALWRAVCSSTLVMGYRIGAQWELQSRRDSFHPLVYVLRRLGHATARGLNLAARIIWPGSFFVDEKVGEHFRVELAGREAPRRAEDFQLEHAGAHPFKDAEAAVRALLGGGPGAFGPERGRVHAALRAQLVARRYRMRDPYAPSRGVSFARGYIDAVERLYQR